MQRTLIILTVICGICHSTDTKLVDQTDIAHPAFLHVVPSTSLNQPVLFISQFGLGPGYVTYVTNLSNGKFTESDIHQIPIQFIWPNDIQYYTSQTFGTNQDVLLVPDGFLPPGKSTGALNVITNPLSSQPLNHKLSKDKSGYFYHRGIARDMNQDGKMDILTARATDPVIGHAGGEMVWFENPGNGDFNSTWKEHVLTQGPEVLFIVLESSPFNDNNDDGWYVISPQFFTEKLMIFKFDYNNNQVWSCNIDQDIGPAYDVHHVDVNGDGQLDLLVTNHVGKDGGSVFAYEFPSNMTCEFKKHLIANGFTVTESGLHQASPGIMFTFDTPSQKKPTIALGGDGSQSAYLISPVDGVNFSYNTEIITKQDGVVGTATGGVVTPDSAMSLFIPNYDKGHVMWYKVTN